MVALSFASDAEANIFFKTVTATVANRSKKRRSRKFSPTKNDGSQDTGYDSGVVLRNQNSTGIRLFTNHPKFCFEFIDNFISNSKLT